MKVVLPQLAGASRNTQCRVSGVSERVRVRCSSWLMSILNRVMFRVCCVHLRDWHGVSELTRSRVRVVDLARLVFRSRTLIPLKK